MKELVRYWGTDYDWRTCEAKLNALPQFLTEIDGLDMHFIHVRSPHEEALPLIVTHGWPGSVIEQLSTARAFVCTSWRYVTSLILSVASRLATVKLFGTLVLCTVLVAAWKPTEKGCSWWLHRAWGLTNLASHACPTHRSQSASYELSICAMPLLRTKLRSCTFSSGS
jgi:Epoxide hydrolase N terminus